VEAQPLAQFQRPAQFVGADLVALDHLRLCLPIGIEAIERVEDEVGRVAGRPRAGDHRVEHTEIGHTGKDQRLGSVRAKAEPRRHARYKCRRRRGRQQIPPSHRNLPSV